MRVRGARPPTEAAYLPRILSAPSHSLSGSRSPSLASWMIAFATVVVSGSEKVCPVTSALVLLGAVSFTLMACAAEWTRPRIEYRDRHHPLAGLVFWLGLHAIAATSSLAS